MKENPDILKKTIRLSNLKKEVVKEEALIKKLEEENKQAEEKLIQLKK